jgi:hypothetical protein
MRGMCILEYNGIIVAGVVGWAVAQILKTILHGVKFKTFYAQRLIGAGGMPSSHTSMVIAALIAVAKKDGTASTTFALMFLFGAIVIYDAMGVRRAAGLHARELNKINEVLPSITNFNLKDITGKDGTKKLQEYLGHTPLEVLGGAIVGIIIGSIIPV